MPQHLPLFSSKHLTGLILTLWLTLATQVFAMTSSEPLVRQEIPTPLQLPNSIDLTIPAENIWDRIRNGYGMIDLSDDLVLYYQQWYTSRPDALRRMVERSRPFLHYIVDELEARGMPTEIALLPMVESAFNPMAYSRANASGLWQFIPATGKRFKLHQDWWRDERRNVLASTNAALDYLQTIYEMHGDWHLALASYNWGEGAVKRAVEKNELRGRPSDYPNLTMPNETRHYVPKLQALKNIFGDTKLRARLGIPDIPNEPYFTTVDTPAAIDIKTAARLANMSLDEFQRLNPSHNRPVIRADSPVVIPADKIDTFRANLENHQAPLSSWQAYTVTSIERLDQIATRFNTTTAELAKVNGVPERARLAPGSSLLVPGTGMGLNNLLNTATPTQIIAAEPVATSCSKKGKRSICIREKATRQEPASATSSHKIDSKAPASSNMPSGHKPKQNDFRKAEASKAPASNKSRQKSDQGAPQSKAKDGKKPLPSKPPKGKRN